MFCLKCGTCLTEDGPLSPLWRCVNFPWIHLDFRLYLKDGYKKRKAKREAREKEEALLNASVCPVSCCLRLTRRNLLPLHPDLSFLNLMWCWLGTRRCGQGFSQFFNYCRPKPKRRKRRRLPRRKANQNKRPRPSSNKMRISWRWRKESWLCLKLSSRLCSFEFSFFRFCVFLFANFSLGFLFHLQIPLSDLNSKLNECRKSYPDHATQAKVLAEFLEAQFERSNLVPSPSSFSYSLMNKRPIIPVIPFLTTSLLLSWSRLEVLISSDPLSLISRVLLIPERIIDERVPLVPRSDYSRSGLLFTPSLLHFLQIPHL